MALIIKNIKRNFIGLIPALIFFYLCLTQFGNQFEGLAYFTFNLQYILVYYWVLKGGPKLLGYGYIFLGGIIYDVLAGLPMGISSLTYLTVASFASYVRTVTVRVSLISDWATFVPAIFISNLFYIITIEFFGGVISVDYIRIIISSVCTILLYPIFWFLFELLKNYIAND